ncbi:MAG TPA: hypothetical protein VII31_09020 [Caldimonas sp.]
MRIHSFGAALAFLVALPAAAQSADGSVMYRCPGNDYNNTLSASEADKRHCKKVENAAVTVIQSVDAASAPAAPPAPPAAQETTSPVDSAALRTRASNARRALEGKLKSEEGRLSTLEKEFNGGEPERHIDEFDFQKYLDRVAGMRSAITRKQIDIAEMRRELEKLPSSR